LLVRKIDGRKLRRHRDGRRRGRYRLCRRCLRFAPEYVDQWSRGRRNRAVTACRAGIFGCLHPQDDAVSFRTQRVLPGAVEVHYNPSDRRVGAIQAYPYRLHAVGVQRIAFLLGVAEGPRKYEYEPVRVGRGLNRGLYRAGEDHLDLHVRTFALDLQLLDFCYAGRRVLAGSVGSQEKERQK
jgi:hypothetical protein